MQCYQVKLIIADYQQLSFICGHYLLHRCRFPVAALLLLLQWPLMMHARLLLLFFC